MTFDLGALAGPLLEAAPDAIVVVDHAGTIRVVNRQAERAFGFARDELVGQPVERLLPGRFHGSHVAQREAYAASPRVRPMGASFEVVALRKDGREFPAEVSLSPVALGDQRFVIAILRDVSERHAANERLRYVSTHDALTGLYNRAYFDEELARLGRSRRFPIAIMIVDLDGLKRRNDAHGHEAGDRLLRRTGELLRQTFRGEDVVARLGGDEFGVLLAQSDAAVCAAAIDRLRRSCAELGREAGSDDELQLSAGGAIAESSERIAAALREADAAMYRDKAARRVAGEP